MKKSIPLILYGAIIILAGIFLVFSKNSSFDMLKYSLGISISVGGALAILTSFAFPKKLVWFAYHEIHALAMLVYGLSVMLFVNTYDKLVYSTAILFVFYAFSEIIFCNRLFNVEQNVHYKTVLVRLSLALVTGLGAVALIYYIEEAVMTVLLGYGILFVLIGINILFYFPITKEDKTVKTPQQKDPTWLSQES